MKICQMPVEMSGKNHLRPLSEVQVNQRLSCASKNLHTLPFEHGSGSTMHLEVLVLEVDV